MSEDFKNARTDLYKYLRDVDAKRQLDLKKLETQEVDNGEMGLSGGDLLLYRIRKILKRLEVIKL